VSDVVIALRRVSKAFDGHVVLDGLDLEVERGETFTILGGSGSGKSVSVKLMIGLLRADRGQVIVNGADVTQLQERDWIPVRQDFGMVFQGSALFDSLSVLDNVSYPLREHTDMSDEEIRKRVAEKLALVGLEGIEEKLPSELSGGMKKRVAVARAVAMDPKVILYDEPTTGLDPANSRRIGELISSLQSRLGVTSVVVTHDLSLCFAVSDRVGLLYEGRLAQVARPDDLRRDPIPQVREFLEGAGLADP
jgi:phospholipid/cholesterol/gamma-HCH transport system ATP-binding protein